VARGCLAAQLKIKSRVSKHGKNQKINNSKQLSKNPKPRENSQKKAALRLVAVF
jgi:hypothetical protein